MKIHAIISWQVITTILLLGQEDVEMPVAGQRPCEPGPPTALRTPPRLRKRNGMNGKFVISLVSTPLGLALPAGSVVVPSVKTLVCTQAGSEWEEKANEIFSLWLLSRKARVYSAT